MAGNQPQWRLIDQTLDRVRVELFKHPAFISRNGGPTPGDVGYGENWAKLERYARILKGARQSIRNSGHLLHAQTLSARRIPREHRYQVNQSLRARQSNLEHVHEKAEILLEILADMTRGYGGPSLSSLKKAAEQGVDILSAVISDPGEVPDPGYNQPSAATPVPPIDMMIALIVYYLLYLLDRDR